MIVVDEVVAAVMGWWWLPRPFVPGSPLTLALSHGGERGLLAVVEGLRPSPPRAYPALLSVLWAPLARAPFAVRKGRIRMCLIDLRGLIADLYLVVRRGTFGLTFPFDEGEALFNARARRAGEGIRMSSLFGRAGLGCVFETSPRLWVASELVDG